MERVQIWGIVEIILGALVIAISSAHLNITFVIYLNITNIVLGILVLVFGVLTLVWWKPKVKAKSEPKS